MSKNKRKNSGKFVLLIILPFIINIITANIGKIGEPDFFAKTLTYLLVGIAFICFYNILPDTMNIEILKLSRLKNYIENVLLSRHVEKIK